MPRGRLGREPHEPLPYPVVCVAPHRTCSPAAVAVSHRPQPGPRCRVHVGYRCHTTRSHAFAPDTGSDFDVRPGCTGGLRILDAKKFQKAAGKPLRHPTHSIVGHRIGAGRLRSTPRQARAYAWDGLGACRENHHDPLDCRSCPWWSNGRGGGPRRVRAACASRLVPSGRRRQHGLRLRHACTVPGVESQRPRALRSQYAGNEPLIGRGRGRRLAHQKPPSTYHPAVFSAAC